MALFLENKSNALGRQAIFFLNNKDILTSCYAKLKPTNHTYQYVHRNILEIIFFFKIDMIFWAMIFWLWLTYIDHIFSYFFSFEKYLKALCHSLRQEYLNVKCVINEVISFFKIDIMFWANKFWLWFTFTFRWLPRLFERLSLEKYLKALCPSLPYVFHLHALIWPVCLSVRLKTEFLPRPRRRAYFSFPRQYDPSK